MAGQTACRWTVLRCKERSFQQFLGVDGEEAAAREVKRRLEIESRTEVDHDPAAAARWDRMRRAYLKFQQQNKESAHAHHND